MRRVAPVLCPVAGGLHASVPITGRPRPARLSVPDAYYGPAGRSRGASRSRALVGAVRRSAADPADRRGERRQSRSRPGRRAARAGARIAGAGAGRAGADRSAPRRARAAISAPGNDRTSFSVGADASWEIDLFGRIRRGIEAAGADAEGVYFDREALRVAIAAEVATNYIQARLAQERLALARDTLAIADDNLQIARWRVEAGLASSLDSEQARAARAQTAAAIPNIENAFTSATYRLAVLTGRAPGALTAELGAGEADPATGRRRSPPAFPPIRCASAPTSARRSAASPPRRRGSASPRRSSIRRFASAAISAPRPSRSAACSTRSPAASSPASARPCSTAAGCARRSARSRRRPKARSPPIASRC